MQSRKCIGSSIVFALILIFGLVPAWPMGGQASTQDQDPGNGNPNDHVKAGYAVITPTEGGTGLVVFETFDQSHGSDVYQAGVLPSEMTTHSVMFVSVSNRLSRNLGIAFTNPSSSPASVNLTLHDEGGTVVATSSLSLQGLHQTARFVTELFSVHQSLLEHMTGTVEIESDKPIAVVGLRFRGSNFSTLPVTRLSIPSPVPQIAQDIGGSNAVILPQFAAGGGWASEIVIVNTGTASMTVRVDLFDGSGLPLVTVLNGQSGSSFLNLKVPVGGVITLAPRDQQGDSDF